MAKLHYHHKFESTDITPYITFGVGGDGAKVLPPAGQAPNIEKFFSYQVGSGINFPLSERINRPPAKQDEGSFR